MLRHRGWHTLQSGYCSVTPPPPAGGGVTMGLGQGSATHPPTQPCSPPWGGGLCLPPTVTYKQSRIDQQKIASSRNGTWGCLK